MSRTHAEFLESLARSRDVSFIVADALGQRGHRVRLVPSSMSPTFEERWQHTDSGDLEVTLRVEVKRVSISFDSRDSFPYPSLIVDEAYKVDKRHELPLYGYVQVNAALTGCLLIPAWTREAWFKDERVDRRDGTKRVFYFCPKDRTHYLPLNHPQSAERVA